MQTYENVIVTVRFRTKCVDMELPAFLNIKELTQKIDETLHSMPGQLVADEHCIGLDYQGKALGQEETLAQSGVWDGSLLDCILGKEAAV